MITPPARQHAIIRTLLLVLLLPFGSHVSAACQKTFSVGWLDWKPYQVWDNDRVKGMDIELLDAVMHQAGCNYVLKNVPWERSMRYIKTGDLDLALGTSKTLERSEWAYFSEAYRREIMAIFVRSNEYTKWNAAQEFEQLADLKPRVMVLRGAYYGSTWSQIKDRFFVHQLNRYEQLIQMLSAQRTDVVLTDLYNGRVLAKELGLENEITTLDWNASDDDIYMMFSKKTVNLSDIDIINRAILELRQSGDLDAIIQRYQ
ncbi:transporter substrate-binding domain-containing protein [uncultured Amphritea sp.]|uniref:substrate-binding periplasmic protein n=1 Tax=uncultured Amphritea sp. TaxID=981605 RepID=UPI002638E38E|nr:transporter substrate-binding domain-containing protein [uncultured Amphritea sp.]